MEPQQSQQTGQQPLESALTAAQIREKFSSLVLRFLNRLKLSGRSAHTIAAYRNDLSMFGRFLIETGHDPAATIGPLSDDWEAFLQGHGRHSAASQRRAQMSVRSFLHFLVENRVITGSSLLVKKSPKQPPADLFAIPESEFKKLLRILNTMAKKGDTKALRDLCLVLVLGKAGLKASEAASLGWQDLHLKPSGNGTLVVPTGEKSRIVPLDPICLKALLQFRELSFTSLRSGASSRDSVFFGYQNVTRQPVSKGMQRHGVKFIVYELCREHLGTSYNAESLRNHAILSFFKKGWDAERIAAVAGYSSLHSLDRFLTPNSTLAHFRRKGRSNRSAEANERTSDPSSHREL